jgi:hypothetical protein
MVASLCKRRATQVNPGVYKDMKTVAKMHWFNGELTCSADYNIYSVWRKVDALSTVPE